MAIQSIANSVGGPPVPTSGNAARPASAEVAQVVATVATPAQPSKEELQRAVKQISTNAAAATANLQFSIDEETGKTLVRVVDKQTGDVIRQIPSEEVLALAKSLDQMKGMLLQGKA